MIGKFVKRYGIKATLKVLQSKAGFYIGAIANGILLTRESIFFKTETEALLALASGKWLKA